MHNQKLLQQLLLLAVFFASSSLSLLAQDAYCFTCNNYPLAWQGIYISGQLGMGQNRDSVKIENDNYFNTLGSTVLGDHFTHKPQGFVGGGAIGYNFQWDSLVIGVEGGAWSTNFKRKRESPFFPATDTFTTHLHYIATAKLRLGYVYESLLIYVSGGWAGGHNTITLTDNQTGIFAKEKAWGQGWNAGVGFDCKCTDYFSMGLAYDFVQLQFPKKMGSCLRCESGVGFGSPELSNHSQAQLLTLRVNIHL